MQEGPAETGGGAGEPGCQGEAGGGRQEAGGRQAGGSGNWGLVMGADTGTGNGGLVLVMVLHCTVKVVYTVLSLYTL